MTITLLLGLLGELFLNNHLLKSLMVDSLMNMRVQLLFKINQMKLDKY